MIVRLAIVRTPWITNYGEQVNLSDKKSEFKNKIIKKHSNALYPSFLRWSNDCFEGTFRKVIPTWSRKKQSLNRLIFYLMDSPLLYFNKSKEAVPISSNLFSLFPPIFLCNQTEWKKWKLCFWSWRVGRKKKGKKNSKKKNQI